MPLHESSGAAVFKSDQLAVSGPHRHHDRGPGAAVPVSGSEENGGDVGADPGKGVKGASDTGAALQKYAVSFQRRSRPERHPHLLSAWQHTGDADAGGCAG